MNSDVILPLCASNDASLYVSLVGLRTCQASTSARILVLCNNTPEPWLTVIRENCEMLGVAFRYVDGPFNMAKTFNLGTRLTYGDYISFASADLIYFPNWFENIVDLWQENPQYWTLCNWTLDRDAGHPCARRDVVHERRIVDTGFPSAGQNVLKRSSEYVWDEQFPFWELDADMHYYMQRNNLKAGYCLNARCDHMIQGIRSQIDYRKNFGIENIDNEFFKTPRKLLEKKWGLSAPV